MKCFCGKDAVNQVEILDFPNSSDKFLNCPRCQECTDRAVNSYDKVWVEKLRREKND